MSDGVDGTEPTEGCDVVMKGGITSGVAYPAAVVALSERYQFRSIGGASAGAIAAAVTAAAQYGRPSGMRKLKELQEVLDDEGLLEQLFQPTRAARPLFQLFLALQRAKSGPRKLGAVLLHGLKRLSLSLAVWLAATFALLTYLARQFNAGEQVRPGKAAWWLLAAVLVGALLRWSLLIGLARIGGVFAGLPSSYYGLCTGKAEGRNRKPALSEWLHHHIQDLAGLPEDEPLTFAHLEPPPGGAGEANAIHLRMMVTDLTLARPQRFPLPDDNPYLFSLDEWASFFPDPVLAHLEAVTEERFAAGPHGPALRQLPGAQLPVLAATRMSLALPVVLAAVPLWQVDEADTPVRHWMSDGGITSNFPIHFFDAWLPTRPTFGLNLIPVRRSTPIVDTMRLLGDAAPPTVHPPGPPPAPPRADIRDVAGLGAQVLDTMQNWRDTLQSELPGFCDRIAHILLEPTEGGMNITMPPNAIRDVAAKGRKAGELLRDDFDFRRHWLTRYESLMRELQVRLGGDRRQADPHGVAKAFTAELQEWLLSGEAERQAGLGHSEAWYRLAVPATQELVEAAQRWLDAAEAFATAEGERPPAVMRMTPDV